MSLSLASLISGITIGFVITYNMEDRYHRSIKKNIYLPVKAQMKEQDEPNYWSRVIHATNNGK